ncbi:MAG TPA: ATP-binding protein [Gemmatimonadaceae bacterium]|nr:ATP-binding protein [Gemmatimonadaceae bacterium]
MRLAHRLLLYWLGIVGLLVVAGFVIERRLHARVTDQTIDNLAREARLVASQWSDPSVSDSLADAAGAALGHRVTLIDRTGVVLGDSHFDGEALRDLDNHSTRPEVALASTLRAATARRVSSSSGTEQFYVAVAASLGVSRVSLPTPAIEAVFYRTRKDVLLAGAVAVALSAVIAGLFARSLSRPIVELRDVARQMADGDLGGRPALSAPGEVGDLATALYRLAEQLGARMAALQADRTLLAAVVGSLEEGVIAVDATARVVQANEAARRLLDLSAPLPFSLDMLPREPLLRDSLSDALRGIRTGPLELTLHGRTLLLTACPLDHGGGVLALFDMTATRRLETVRRDFVANVSHELRTPLTVIAGFTETLAEEGVPPEKRRQFSEMILTNTSRMQRIVDDLLDLSRIESGGWLPNPSVLDVEAVIDEAFTGVRAAADAKGIRLESQVDPAARDIYMDRTALRQILSNLLENAIRYTVRGAVTVATARAEGGVSLSVSDTGSGIPAEHLPRIFERFYRADSGRARESGGTGLGLAIVRHLVESHGGRVEAASVEGAGTTIIIFLPAASIAAASIAAARS